MPAFLVSGTVVSTLNAGIFNVTMSFIGTTTPALVYTNVPGDYLQSLPDVGEGGDWEGTITPSHPLYTFSPTFRYFYTYAEGQRTDFTGSLLSSLIQGKVTSSLGISLQNMTMSFANGVSTVYTNITGDYVQSIPPYWSGSITPTSSLYNFYPATQHITESTNTKVQNFFAIRKFTSGSGIISSPYAISNYEDMYNVRYNMSSSTYYILNSNINLSYFVPWTPISGTFQSDIDGREYTISNLLITGSSINSYYGLFEYISSSNSIKNINFDNCIVSMSNGPNNNDRYVGILSAYLNIPTASNISLTDCIVQCSSSTQSDIYAGGISAISYGSLTSCSVESSTIKIVGEENVDSYAGGLIGKQVLSQIKYSYVKNSIIYINRGTLGGENYIGGLVGGEVTASDCYVLRCTIEGYSTENKSVGISTNGILTRCYSSFYSGNMPSGSENVYPVSYDFDTTVATNVYYESGSITHRTASAGTGLSQTNMKISSSYANWNFANIWSRNPSNNSGYPYLNFQGFIDISLGLVTYYDSRIAYDESINLWQDLSGYGHDSITVNTYYTESAGRDLLFTPDLLTSQAPIDNSGVSSSFAIEIWTAPTASTNRTLFTSYAGVEPNITGFIDSGNFLNFTYDSQSIKTTSAVNINKFNHTIFLVSGTKGFIWLNGVFENSTTFIPDSWQGGKIGISSGDINVYHGYINVFKIWNGPEININTVNTYYANRNYWPGLPYVTIMRAEIPSIPVAIPATSITSASFMANWNHVNMATSYYFDVSTGSGFPSYVPGYTNKNAGDEISSSVVGLTGGTDYYYRVRAYNYIGTSSNSNIISLTTVPLAPVATSATNILSGSFMANWSSSLGATSYYLDVSTGSNFPSYTSGYDNKNIGNSLSSSVTGLLSLANYYYRVRAYNSSGTSSNSNTIYLTTLSNPVTESIFTIHSSSLSYIVGAVSIPEQIYNVLPSSSLTYVTGTIGFAANKFAIHTSSLLPTVGIASSVSDNVMNNYADYQLTSSIGITASNFEPELVYSQILNLEADKRYSAPVTSYWYDTSVSGTLSTRYFSKTYYTSSTLNGISVPYVYHNNGSETDYFSTFPTPIPFINPSWTFITLIRAEYWTGSDGYQAILSAQGNNADELISLRISGSKFQPFIRDESGNAVFTATDVDIADRTIANRTWKLAVATFDYSTKTMRVYASGSANNISSSNASYVWTPGVGTVGYDAEIGIYIAWPSITYSQRARCEYAEILFYGSVLGNFEINNICHRIANKYALDTGSQPLWVDI